VCQQSDDSLVSSFTQTTFTNVAITNLNNSTIVTIPFTINSGGTAAPISCTGQNIIFTPQSYKGSQLDKLIINSSPNILKTASYPTISFSQNQISNTNINISPYLESSLKIYFRQYIYIYRKHSSYRLIFFFFLNF
jgi:hypothetical protein